MESRISPGAPVFVESLFFPKLSVSEESVFFTESPVSAFSEEAPVSAISDVVPASAISEVVPVSAVTEVIPVSAVSEAASASVLSEVPPAFVLSEVSPAFTLSEVPPAFTLSEVPPAFVLSEEVSSFPFSEARPGPAFDADSVFPSYPLLEIAVQGTVCAAEESGQAGSSAAARITARIILTFFSGFLFVIVLSVLSFCL